MSHHSASFHATCSRNFLGLRHNPHGVIEIVYDDGVSRRMVWRAAGPGAAEPRICEALRLAVEEQRVVPALYAELTKRAISIEAAPG